MNFHRHAHPDGDTGSCEIIRYYEKDKPVCLHHHEFGSTDPQSLTGYDETEWGTYDGYVMAVVRAGTEEGKIKVVFTAEGHKEQSVEFEVRKQTETSC